MVSPSGAGAAKLTRLNRGNDLPLAGPQYYSRQQVAALFGVSPQSVSRWAKEGRLPCILTPGGHRRFPREAVELLLERLRPKE